mmetsp:Transcript_8935/g.14892  ORF Transcript_8935/g.14892 Transcript_8935/m.14892 type:complete len:227 (+) Transcript_8935:87-767(+)|eukprot:CAMPEP_0119005084 /NCGR_PEP_ID=MMETSP1176-20130426/1519_1 /TAXON_ID=265551 /ORGANISM="Synedropsis recta cf, Strain CCMP1620" /LENGTH=226 /DNA_ID=CAMNT_0006956851 /DNA_START=81 /DNA_END=761 /DNA_ORIENTATION=+
MSATTPFDVTFFVNVEKEFEDEVADTIMSVSVAEQNRKGCDACFSFIALQLAGVGFFASISSTLICNYAAVTNSLEAATAVGIWMIPDGDSNSIASCTYYPADTPFDALFQIARAMSVLAPTFCFAGLTLSYFAETGSAYHQERRLLVSICLLLAAAFMQGMTLMLLESTVCLDHAKGDGDACGLSSGGLLSIGSAAFMSFAIFFLLITGRKDVVLVSASNSKGHY